MAKKNRTTISPPDDEIMEKADIKLKKISQTRSSIFGLLMGVIAEDPTALAIVSSIYAIGKATEKK